MAEDERWNRDTVPAAPSGSRPSSRRVIASPFDPPPRERFEEGDELGRGGMGRVFEARDVALDRAVAIKQSLTDDAQMLVRFEREALITAQLQHPGIVPVLDAGRDANGRPYYVMRKIEGRPLATVVAESTDARARLALLPNMLAAIDAVAYAHARGVIHRDLKPWNILLGPFGETFVIDWGLARDLAAADATGGVTISGDDGLTRVGSALGTPGFMAPEQARGDAIDRRADVYALGATLVHLLAGVQPFAGVDPTVAIEAVARDEVPRVEFPDVVPTELRAIAEKAMAGSRDERYADAGELASDLRRFLGGQLVAAHEYTVREHVVRWVRKHRIAVAVASIATIAIVAISTIAIRNVVVARDEARDARQRADERADELLVDRAEAIATTDATYAIALLKQLSPDSRTWGRARVVATTAVASGVSRGAPVVQAGMYGRMLASPSGELVAVVEDSRILLVEPSLQTPARVLLERPEGFTGFAWFDDDTLIATTKSGVELVGLDGSTRKVDPGGRSISLVTDSGEPRIFAKVDGRLRELDPEGGPPLADLGEHKLVQRFPGLTIYGEDEGQFTFHEDGKPPAIISGFSLAKVMVTVHPSHDRIAMFDHLEVVEIERTNGVWAERGRWGLRAEYVVYRDKALYAIESSGIATLWRGMPPQREAVPITRDRSILPNGAIATELGVFVAGDSAIFVMHGGRVATIATYRDPPTSFASADHHLLVLARTGTLRSYDLRQFLPESVRTEPGTRAEGVDAAHGWFVRNEQLLVYDLAARTLAPLKGAYTEFDESSLACAGPDFALVHLDERRRFQMKQPARLAVLARDGSLTPIKGTYTIAICTPSQRWLALQSQTSVELRDPHAPHTTGRVFTTNQPIRGISINETFLSILDETGTLTRYELPTGRVHATDHVGDVDLYAVDARGRLATVKGDAVTLYSGGASKLVVDKVVVGLITGHQFGILVFTRDKSLVVIDQAERVRRYDVGEMALAVAWDAPRVAIILEGKPAVLDLRDGGVVHYPWTARSVVISRDGAAIAWTSSTGESDIIRIDVPEQPREILRWLDRITNATLEPGSTEVTWR